MSNTIIGTAGHVDHGKTALIKALTGIETDRLSEERRRGITIELGFAYLALPDGEKAGIIDVPGHEKFIKNMLAGAGSIDVALLVVAADEGFMPQTREHLGILSLLGIERGVIALTKADLADEEWRELVLSDIAQEVQGTFLMDAPVLPVSAYTGEGMDALRECLIRLVQSAPQKEAYVPFRLPVDRVFSMDGFGTVVTGTLTEGVLKEGDTITVYPHGRATKARNIQVHGQNVDCAFAGQRVAVNLAGVKHTEVSRGDTLAAPDSMELSQYLDVRLDNLKGSGREITNNSRLHLYHGTGDRLCRVVLFSGETLPPGESAYAQLRLQEPFAARPGDRFVVRFYSPMETIGGGILLDPAPAKHTARDIGGLQALRALENGTLQERLSCFIRRKSVSFPSLSVLRRTMFREDPMLDEAAQALCGNGEIVLMTGDRFVHREFLFKTGKEVQRLLAEYHRLNPLREGMRREELWTKLLPSADIAMADRIIAYLSGNGTICVENSRIRLPDFTAQMNEHHSRLADAVLQIYSSAGIEAPSQEELGEHFPKEKKALKQVLDRLADQGALVLLDAQAVLHQKHYAASFQAFRRLAQEKGEVTLAQFRDELHTSRKYALAILDCFDRRGLTKKTGDVRKLAAEDGL